MEVTRSNFNSKLPEVAEAIREASFLTIDGEFTGLHNGKLQHCFELPAERYGNIREGAMEFLLLQFGLGAFKYLKDKDRYEVKAFNFYTFPRSIGRQTPEVMFLCQSSSIEFLINTGFDFNKAFKDGISYLLPKNEKRLREQMIQRHQQELQNVSTSNDMDELNMYSPIPVPQERKEYIDQVCERVKAFMESDGEQLELEPCNGFVRKLIYQTVKDKFQLGIHIDTKINDKGDRYILITKANVERRVEMVKEKHEAQLEELSNALGFSKVITLISESSKLVIGHNMLLDVCHVLNQFSCKLPSCYDDFKTVVTSVFPRLLDTKLMANTLPFKDLISNSALGDLQTALTRSPFKTPLVEAAEHFPAYSTDDERLHEAGYDAYITGICFIAMANYLGGFQPCDKDVANSSLVQPFINKLFLMRVHDIPYINLNGDDLNPSRDHVFHITFPKEWKGSDLIQLFQPFGNVYIAWLDDTSALVGLNRKEQSRVVMKTLTQSDTYHVQQYADYAAQRLNKLTTKGGDASSCGGWPRKRALPESDVHLPTKRKRSGSFEGVSSARSIDPIPEEEEVVTDGGEMHWSVFTTSGF